MKSSVSIWLTLCSFPESRDARCKYRVKIREWTLLKKTDLSDNIHQVSGVTSLKECSCVWEQAKKRVIHELTVYYELVLSRDGEMISE